MKISDCDREGLKSLIGNSCPLFILPSVSFPSALPLVWLPPLLLPPLVF
jgi:hypothetical protein